MLEPQLKKLTEAIDSAHTLIEKQLVTRPDWGAINFEDASVDLERIKTVVGHLKILPVEELTDQVGQQMATALTNVSTQLEKIDTFTVETGDAGSTKDQLVTQIHTQADAIVTATAQWIPYLAYLRGDIETNISKLSSAVERGAEIANQAVEDAEVKLGELDGIISKAREASGKAGVAVFTKDFEKEADDNETDAKPWLVTAGGLGIFSVVVASGMWVQTIWFPQDGGQDLQIFGTKIAILGILFTATLWCGRVYKGLIHQHTLNKHKALSLQTFQAFIEATDNDSVKDAVLLETTRAIFDTPTSGMIEGKSHGDSSKIVIEAAKSMKSIAGKS